MDCAYFEDDGSCSHPSKTRTCCATAPSAKEEKPMFICQGCIRTQGWFAISVSRGLCELCNLMADCADIRPKSPLWESYDRKKIDARIAAIAQLKKDALNGKGIYIPTEEEIIAASQPKMFNANEAGCSAEPAEYRGNDYGEDESKICYQCEKRVVYLFDDGRCEKCTRLTPEEVRGEE